MVWFDFYLKMKLITPLVLPCEFYGKLKISCDILVLKWFTKPLTILFICYILAAASLGCCNSYTYSWLDILIRYYHNHSLHGIASWSSCSDVF